MDTLPNNQEIDAALKEFEAKSKSENRSISQAPTEDSTETPKMVGWVMKISGGTIKNKKEANQVLAVFVVIAIIISAFLFFFTGSDLEELPPEELFPAEFTLSE